MTAKFYVRRLLLAFLILAGCAPLLPAQSAASSADTKNEPRLIQRLVWTGGEYALRFEVVVQREVNGRYIAHLREFTELPFIEVSLPPGKYRFQVTSYNILDKPEDVSRWVNITVRPGVQNETFSTTPELVSGKDSAKADPAGDTSEGRQLKPILLFAGAAWTPVLPLHGDFFGDSFSLAGAGARFGAAFSVPRDLYLGAEATTFWHNSNLNNANADNASADNDASGHILLAGVNLLAMKWLQNQKTALTYRFGCSFIVLPDTQEKLVFTIGASYLWRVGGAFLLEAGFDYAGRLENQLFDGCIRPWIGIGMVF